ncbi:hypothetical protein RIF29_09646 [Crotalaria pallida]|uniref:GTD-binding domain-containing protein n=1 Tax=Crotalaria pallida TaxID=3830 RepID=A0AAN9FUK9_CROPI
MAETSTCSVMAQTQGEVAAMKETLHAQQQLLQKLCIELDQEREASATAASEALDMILRLQGEKAAVKMEASHYKRMAEEKIGHAEATVEIFEELLYQKDMEIASLEFQIQAYKQKLLSLGCDFSASEFEFPDDLLLNRVDQQNAENGQSSTVRRLNSLPPLPFKNSSRVPRIEERSSSPVPIPVSDMNSNVVEGSTDKKASPPTLDSYWEQIRKLDEKVKVISDCTEGEKSGSMFSKRGKYQIGRLPSSNLDKVIHDGSQDRKDIAHPPCPPNVHDVFEVPQTSENHKVSEHGRKRLVKWYSEVENRLTKPDPVSEGMFASHVKHDAEKRKGILRVQSEIKIPCPNDNDMMTITGQHGVGVDSSAQAQFQKLHQRIERLEREIISSREEIIHERDGEEQLRLLKGIQSQLTLIQSEMRSCKPKISTPKDDVSLRALQEIRGWDMLGLGWDMLGLAFGEILDCLCSF